MELFQVGPCVPSPRGVRRVPVDTNKRKYFPNYFGQTFSEKESFPPPVLILLCWEINLILWNNIHIKLVARSSYIYNYTCIIIKKNFYWTFFVIFMEHLLLIYPYFNWTKSVKLNTKSRFINSLKFLHCLYSRHCTMKIRQQHANYIPSTNLSQLNYTILQLLPRQNNLPSIQS